MKEKRKRLSSLLESIMPFSLEHSLTLNKKKSRKSVVSAFHTLGGNIVEIFKPLGVSFGGKPRVKVVTLFLTPLFRLTPNEAKGGRP